LRFEKAAAAVDPPILIAFRTPALTPVKPLESWRLTAIKAPAGERGDASVTVDQGELQ
jgi:hypothetical protein